jgi:hypothetical protein
VLKTTNVNCFSRVSFFYQLPLVIHHSLDFALVDARNKDVFLFQSASLNYHRRCNLACFFVYVRLNNNALSLHRKVFY